MSKQPKYQHVVKAIYETPWAIQRSTLETILEVVRFRSGGGMLSDDEIQQRLSAAENGPRRGRRNGLVAVLPLYGVISPRQNLMSATSGGTSLDQLTAVFREVMADPDIAAVVFDVDSPGGTVDGVEEFANEIRAARGQKPIVAVANTLMASAALWALSGVDEIVASPSSELGSVGVIAAHQDLSGHYEQEGVVTTLITSSEFKAEGNEFEPLSEDALADITRRVSHFGTMFETTLAKGRGVSIEAVKAKYGRGRVLTAKDAIAVGMADRIDTLDNTIRRLASGGTIRPLATPDPADLLDARAAAESQAFTVNALVIDTDEGGPPAGLPFAAHAERVLLDLTALARRAGEIRALRAEDGRDLSEAKREELAAIAAQLLDAHGSFTALLAPPAAEDSAPLPTSRKRQLVLAEAQARGYPLN